MLPEATALRERGSGLGPRFRTKHWAAISTVVVLGLSGSSWWLLHRNTLPSHIGSVGNSATSPEAASQKQDTSSVGSASGTTLTSVKTNPANQAGANDKQPGKPQGNGDTTPATDRSTNPPPPAHSKKWWEEKPSFVAEGGAVADYSVRLGLLSDPWKRDQDGTVYQFSKQANGGLDFRAIRPSPTPNIDSEHVERIERFGPGNTAWPAVRITITWDLGVHQIFRTFTFLPGAQKLDDCLETALYHTGN